MSNFRTIIISIFTVIFIGLVFTDNALAFSINKVVCNDGSDYIILSDDILVGSQCKLTHELSNGSGTSTTNREVYEGHRIKASNLLSPGEKFSVECGGEIVRGQCAGSPASSTVDDLDDDDPVDNQDSGVSVVDNGDIKVKNDDNVYVKPTYKASIGIPFETLFSGVSYDFKVKAERYAEGRTIDLLHGIFKLNFGDGTYYEFERSKDFSHVYEYPGNYVLVFEYYTSWMFDEINEPTSVFRKNIVVTSPEIIIKSLNDEAGVIIKNKTNEEIDLSNWSLVFGVRKFIFKNNTFLLKKSETTFSEKILNLGLYPKASGIYLLSPREEVIATSLVEKIPVKKIIPKTSSFVKKIDVPVHSNFVSPESKDVEEKEIEEDIYEYFSASVVNSDVQESDRWLWIIISALTAISFLTVLFRRNFRKSGGGEVTSKEFDGNIDDDDIKLLE